MAGGNRFGVLYLHRNLNEGKGGTAECLIFAEDEREVATDLCIGERNSSEHVGLNVFLRVGPRDEAQTHISGNEALQQFAGIKFHRITRFEFLLVKQFVECISS